QLAFAADHENRVEEYRYGEVLGHVNAISAGLEARGIQRGDRVGILMENIPQWVFVLLGAMRIGAITVPLPTTLPENSIRLLVEHAGCKLIVGDEENWEKARGVGGTEACLVDGLFGQHHPAAPGRCLPRHPSSPSDSAIIIYTSGTTG